MVVHTPVVVVVKEWSESGYKKKCLMNALEKCE